MFLEKESYCACVFNACVLTCFIVNLIRPFYLIIHLNDKN
jgi:hypothetical protein